MSRVNIISPVYFDVPCAVELMRNIKNNLPNDEVHFFFVDDSAGADKEMDDFSQTPGVTVVRPIVNLGHQRAIVFALRKLVPEFDKNDIVVTLDSDGEDLPEHIPSLIDSIKDDYSFSLARRTKRQESPLFKFMYFFFKLFFRAATGITVKTGNFACFKVKAIKKIIHHPFFDLCYSSVFLSLKLNLNLVPCERGKRYSGESKMNTVGLISHGIKMLMPFLDRISIRALMACAVISLFSLSSVVLGLSLEGVFSYLMPRSIKVILLSSFVISTLAGLNMMVLFSIFNQSMRDAYKFVDLESIAKNKTAELKKVS